jgi:hypothetical protein
MRNTVKKLKNRRLRIFNLNMKRPRTNLDLLHLTALPEMPNPLTWPNQDERRSIRIEWPKTAKGSRKTKNTNTSDLLLNDALYNMIMTCKECRLCSVSGVIFSIGQPI